MIVEDSSASLVAMSAYMDMNAVRSNLVDNPSDYPYCGLGEATDKDGMARQGLLDLLRTEQEKLSVVAPLESSSDSPSECPPVSLGWSEMAARYRQMLWGDGVVKRTAQPLAENLAVAHGESDPGGHLETMVMAAGGAALIADVTAAALAGALPSSLKDLPPTHERELVLADFFRWRQDVFLRAAAMGSKAFIERIFLDNRDSFGASQETAAKMVLIRGIAGGWRFEGMRVLPAFRLPPSRFDDG
jgi:hypothetical protein